MRISNKTDSRIDIPAEGHVDVNVSMIRKNDRKIVEIIIND